MVYNPATDEGRVRLLVTDTAEPYSLSDDEILAFLAMEAGNVKRAAAQALDTLASNEAFVSKVIRTQDVATDGAKVAAVLHQRATTLRKQADTEDGGGEGFAVEFAAFSPYGQSKPELAEWPYWP